MSVSDPHSQRTSAILAGIIARPGDGSISVERFTSMLGERAFALAILIFALPNSLPIPGIPGVSTVTGLPITFFALQMILGRDTIWLPKKIAQKEFSEAGLKKILAKTLPAVRWLEKYLRPRMHWLCGAWAERALGLGFAILSLIIALPIPGGNFLPGLSMSIIALALLERDGLIALGGVVFATCSVFFMYDIIVGAFRFVLGLF